MKKAFSLFLVVMLVAGLSVSALASNIADSKELAVAPEALDEDTTVTFAADTAAVKEAVETLKDAKAEDLVDAENETYAAIAEALAELNEAEGANYASVKINKVFEAEGADGQIEKTIKAPAKFVGLFKLVDGKWERVEVEVDENGNFTFIPEEGVVYATFVADEASPATGESFPYALMIAAIVLAGGAVVFFRKSRKANA